MTPYALNVKRLLFKQLRKTISVVILVAFISTSIKSPAFGAQDPMPRLPAPGTMVNLSPAFQPALIKGLTVHQDNPFLFDFIVDKGHSNLSGEALKNEGDRLVKYFFACLTIPEKDLWVNLSPYEKSRMIPKALGQTALGRDLLAQDYILKQLTASLIYPEKNLGKEFWNRVYAKAQAQYGTSQIPVNTFNKVWILADKATVYEHGQTAFIVDGHLKVMLDEDYLALSKTISLPGSDKKILSLPGSGKVHSLASQIVRQIILPEIEKEVNQGQNFAMLRQIFYSQILATWYKNNLKEALLNQVYTDKSTVKGVNLNDPSVKERIYQQYIKAYKKGVFNFIKDDVTADGQTIPRKYFSGGYGTSRAMLTTIKSLFSPQMRNRVSRALSGLMLPVAITVLLTTSAQAGTTNLIATTNNLAVEEKPFYFIDHQDGVSRDYTYSKQFGWNVLVLKNGHWETDSFRNYKNPGNMSAKGWEAFRAWEVLNRATNGPAASSTNSIVRTEEQPFYFIDHQDGVSRDYTYSKQFGWNVLVLKNGHWETDSFRNYKNPGNMSAKGWEAFRAWQVNKATNSPALRHSPAMTASPAMKAQQEAPDLEQELEIASQLPVSAQQDIAHLTGEFVKTKGTGSTTSAAMVNTVQIMFHVLKNVSAKELQKAFKSKKISISEKDKTSLLEVHNEIKALTPQQEVAFVDLIKNKKFSDADIGRITKQIQNIILSKYKGKKRANFSKFIVGLGFSAVGLAMVLDSIHYFWVHGFNTQEFSSRIALESPSIPFTLMSGISLMASAITKKNVYVWSAHDFLESHGKIEGATEEEAYAALDKQIDQWAKIRGSILGFNLSAKKFSAYFNLERDLTIKNTYTIKRMDFRSIVTQLREQPYTKDDLRLLRARVSEGGLLRDKEGRLMMPLWSNVDNPRLEAVVVAISRLQGEVMTEAVDESGAIHHGIVYTEGVIRRFSDDLDYFQFEYPSEVEVENSEALTPASAAMTGLGFEEGKQRLKVAFHNNPQALQELEEVPQHLEGLIGFTTKHMAESAEAGLNAELIFINRELLKTVRMTQHSAGRLGSSTIFGNSFGRHGVDMAMPTKGGIDLNAANMGMTVTKDANGGVKVSFDPALIARIRRIGLTSAVPIIINVADMKTDQISPLLGLDKSL